MEYTIDSISEIVEYEGKHGVVYQFYCTVSDGTGEEADVRIDAKSPDRWEVGSIVELEDKGFKPWERKGVAYTVVKANVPERLRQNGGGNGSSKSRSFSGSSSKQNGTRKFGGASRNGFGANRQNSGVNRGSTQPPEKVVVALPFETAVALYGRLATVVPSEHSRAVLFQAILNGRVEQPPTDFADSYDEPSAEDEEFFEQMGNH